MLTKGPEFHELRSLFFCKCGFVELLETQGRTCGCTSLLVQEFVVKMY
jgi:hypothetical protein